MEQTLVNQFFPAVKNSFQNHPAKRRKVSESPGMEDTLTKQKGNRAKSITRTSLRTSRAKKEAEISLSKLFTAAPVNLSSEATSIKDQHSELKRKIPEKRSRKASKSCSKPVDSNKPQTETIPVVQESSLSRGSLKTDPWILEQSKLVLQQGRGKAAVNAARSQEPAQTKSLKPSDILKPDPPQVNVTLGNVREECAKKFRENSEQPIKGRGRLRQKYAHLLNQKEASSELSSSEKIIDNVQSSTKRIPAHQRFKHLAADKPAVAFTLPQKYKNLLEMFRCADSVMFLLHRRSETCTFERLKKSVQSMLGKKFTQQHLAQMKTIYPKGFIFRQEKNLRDLNGMPTSQQLTIDANFEEVVFSKASKEAVSQTVLITRKNLFESSLVDITKKHHQKFLRKLNLKIVDSDLHRWHPNFKLEEVPDIPEATLPQATTVQTCTSAKDMLQKTSCIPQVERALQRVAELKDKNDKAKCNDASTKTSNTDPETNNTKTNSNNNILKGVSNSILERIKQKEMKNAELSMLRNPEQEKRLGIMDRLPDCVRILKTYFTTERKAAIAMEDCVKKLSESFGAISSLEKIEEQVRLLNELVPDWLFIVNVRKCPYLKIAKNSDVNIVLNKLISIKAEESKR